MAVIPDGLRLALDPDPTSTLRPTLAAGIHAFHAATVPGEAQRFGLRLLDGSDRLVAGLSGAMLWGWLFIEALWVDAPHRGSGAGRCLLLAAERHAAAAGCQAAWLDTFQVRGFYEAMGYTVFGTLEHYPAGQTRSFLRKALRPDPDCPATGIAQHSVTTNRGTAMASDLQDLEQALQTYFDGLYEGDTAKLGAVFHDVAHLFSVTDGKLNDLPKAEWFAAVRGRKTPQSQDLPRRDWIVQIDRSGPDTAFAKVQCQIPPRYFTDYLTFVRLAEGWRIVSKTFHTDTH